jgi:hypothetical protein
MFATTIFSLFVFFENALRNFRNSLNFNSNSSMVMVHLTGCFQMTEGAETVRPTHPRSALFVAALSSANESGEPRRSLKKTGGRLGLLYDGQTHPPPPNHSTMVATLSRHSRGGLIDVCREWKQQNEVSESRREQPVP